MYQFSDTEDESRVLDRIFGNSEFHDELTLLLKDKKASKARAAEFRKKNGKLTGYSTVIHRRCIGVDSRGKKQYRSKFLSIGKLNILTTLGRDWMHAQVYTNTSAGTQGARYIALTVDATGTDAADSTLPGEITTNGLQRINGAPAHSASANTSTLTKTFTASGTHTAVQMAGTFEHASVGTLVHENIFTPTTLISGDDLQIVWTFTLG